MSKVDYNIRAGSSTTSVKIKSFWKKVLMYSVCTLLTIISIFPFWVLIVNSTRESYDIQGAFSIIPSNYLMINLKSFFTKSNIDVFQSFFNSLFISSTATILTVYFSSLTAYGLVVYNFKLRKAAFTFIMVVLMIPPQVSIIGFITFMMRIGLMDSFIPLIIPAIAAPATVFFMRQFLLTSLPLEIVEAGRIDGTSEFGIFNRIALPIMKPAIATQAIFCFIGNWNNLFLPSMILNSESKRTMPMLVSILSSERYRTDFGMVYLGLLITILPMIVIYLFLSQYIVRGVALGGVKE